ncbi:hypothetical protein ABEB36_005136 [Hypothenemus hampei]|uniref:Protein kinase domain-containing protein n=1 Tax=Hypothenemus hampei TaxID=57062 RepID=A0ABD1EX40_HYPHA
MTLQEPKGKKLYVVGSYRFSGKLLGKGNFARVEEAVHTMLNVKVAIKIIDINQIKEDYVIKNLFREAKLMAKLNHPCICALYQTMQRSDKLYFLVTELASGGDLCTFVKDQRNGCLEERSARIYVRQFVSAVAHMHNIGVVHRDLKMENVMLNAARTQIKIVDFGLGNFYEANEPLKTHCGSPEYAAPELFITGMKYGPEVDLWSLGIIFYGMVVGQLPFVSDRNEQMTSHERRKKLVAQINRGLGNIHKRALAGFSADFRNMVCRMLMPDVSKRISIKEMLLHPFITEKGTKLIRINPMKKLELGLQAEIFGKMAELAQQPTETIVQAVKQEPYSRIGGMYNILAHRLSLNRLTGDGLSRMQPLLEIESKTRTDRFSVTKSYNLRCTVAYGHTPRRLVQEKKLSQEFRPATSPPLLKRPNPETIKQPSNPKTVNRPSTVQDGSLEKRANYQEVKTPFMTRKAHSAAITSKTNRTSSICSPIGVKLSSTMNTKITKNMVKRLYPSAAPNEPTLEGLEKVIKKKNSQTTATELKNNKPTKSAANEETKTETVFKRKQRSKSEKISTPSPIIELQSSIKRSLATTQSDSKATSKRPQTTSLSKEDRPITRLPKLTRPATSSQNRENSQMACGDIVKRIQVAQQMPNRKPIIYDPIARSIAGYVCNNVPDYKLPMWSNFKR